MLGEEQSGHINAIGYEMYMELLESAIKEQKGEPIDSDDVDPEINLRIPALIPDNYIPDIRDRYFSAQSFVNGCQRGFPAPKIGVKEFIFQEFELLLELIHPS